MNSIKTPQHQTPQQKTSNMKHSRNLSNNAHLSTINLGSNIYCQQHPDEQISNFCLCSNCNIPLCPECLETHSQWHKSYNSHPDIKSYKYVKNYVAQIVNDAQSQLKDLLQRIDNKDYHSNKQIQLRTLEQSQEKLVEVVNRKFNEISTQYATVYHSTLNQNPFGNLLQKLENKLQEFERLNQNLQTHQCLEAIDKTQQLDIHLIQNNINRSIQEITSTNSNVEVYVNEQRLSYIDNELDRIVNIQRKTPMKISQNIINDIRNTNSHIVKDSKLNKK